MDNATNSDSALRAVVKIISTACRRCRDCIEICPEEALSWTEGQVAVDEERCTGCGRCVQVCRVRVLKISSK